MYVDIYGTVCILLTEFTDVGISTTAIQVFPSSTVKTDSHRDTVFKGVK